MRKFFESIKIASSLVFLNSLSYHFFLKPIITAWGATPEEISMPMAGDDKACTILSTRAILINAPKSEVWKWLMQLGADRGGFYSYGFIEKVMGYKTRYPNMSKPEFGDIKEGDLIRGSIDEKSSIIPYSFKVLHVKPEETFVLENWGTFLLQAVNNHQTRLIIRTQEVKASSVWPKVTSYIIVPLHFIMERRMLIGIKMRAEEVSDDSFLVTKDLLWFWGIVFSWFLIFFLVLIGRGFTQSIFMPVFFSVCWLLVLFLLDPIFFYSILLLLSLYVSVLTVVLMKINRS